MFNALKVKTQNCKYIALCAVLSAAPQYALAVNKADSGINNVSTWLGTIIPVILGAGLLVLAALYAMGFVGKEMFKQVGGGLIFGGAGSWLISLFL